MHRRQIFWAHLIRKFAGFVERKGTGSQIARQLQEIAELMSHHWHRVRDGTMSRRAFRKRMERVRQRFEWLLERGVNLDAANTVNVRSEDRSRNGTSGASDPQPAAARRARCTSGAAGIKRRAPRCLRFVAAVYSTNDACRTSYSAACWLLSLSLSLQSPVLLSAATHLTAAPTRRFPLHPPAPPRCTPRAPACAPNHSGPGRSYSS